MSEDSLVHIGHAGSRLVVEIEGDYSLVRLKAIVHMIREAATAQPTTSVLIDARRVVGHIGIIDRFRLGVHLARHGPKVHTAILATSSQLRPDRFMQVVATNRGAKVKGFPSQAEAEEWLQRMTATPRRPPNGDHK